jgi:hypothetical protein
VEAQVLLGRELLVQRLLLEDQADPPADLGPLPDDVEAGDPGGPGGGVADGAEHLDGGGLPGPVGPQEAVGLPGLDAQVDAPDRFDDGVAGRVALGQAARVDRGLSNGVRHSADGALTPLGCQA